MTAGPTIDYEALAQDAMRGVVRTVLSRAAKNGLPGDHHFYISFDTQATGVIMSKRLKEKYPQEMTIVLQHRFWDLAVTDERFEVKLTFDGIPERLVIPFSAIKVFFDPSVRYGLQFEEPDAGGEAGLGEGDSDDGSRPTAITTRSSSPRKPRAPRAKSGRDKDDVTPLEPVLKPATEVPRVRPALAPVAQAGAQQNAASRAPQAEPKAEPKPEPKDKAGASPADPAAAELPPDAANKPGPAPAAGAQIVSLDAFRKK